MSQTSTPTAVSEPQDCGFDLTGLLWREEGFRRGLAWAILNHGELADSARDQYFELQALVGTETLRTQWGFRARSFLESLSVHTGLLFDFHTAPDEAIHSYLFGAAFFVDNDDPFCEILAYATDHSRGLYASRNAGAG